MYHVKLRLLYFRLRLKARFRFLLVRWIYYLVTVDNRVTPSEP